MPPPDLPSQAWGLAAALAAGLLIGTERGWTLRKDRAGTRVAGTRTFTLLALCGGVAGAATTLGAGMVGAVLVLAGAAMLVIGYAAPPHPHRDATTPIAALTTLAIGFLAGVGMPGLALAAAAVVVFLLALRDEIHRVIARFSAEDVKALARFAALALALLPFLPNRAMGPYDALNPAHLWWVVVLVTGFSFLAYVANRLAGPTRGTLVAALIGGAYSSTAVTQSLAQRLGSDDRGGAESAGIAIASAVMFVRVIVLVAVLANRLLWPFLVVIGPALAVAWLAALILYRRAPSAPGPTPPGNPIALLPALGFAAFVAVGAVAARWAQSQFGESGIAALLFMMGVMDVDTSIVTAGGLPPATIAAPIAAAAIGGTIVANMAVKIGVTMAYARRRGVGAALALCASAATLAATVAWRWLVG